MAVDQDRFGLEAAVAVVQPVDHERRPEVRGLRVQMGFAVGGAHALDVGATDVVQVLRGDVPLEDVLEVRRKAEVNVEEVRHVYFHELAHAIGNLNEWEVKARGL